MSVLSLGDLVNHGNSALIHYCIVLLLGVVVIWAFASKKYDEPTYAKTSIGNLGELSPRSLASDQRYLKGFYIYLVSLICLYMALCVIGPKAIDALGLPIPDALRGPELWPIGLATVMAATGALSDNKFPGNIEALIRRKSHEAAYIPKAVYSLKADLAAFDVAQWIASVDPKTVQAVQEYAFDDPGPAIQIVAKLTEGKLVSWARGNILFYSFLHLPREYSQIKAEREPKAAFRFLEALQISIKTKLERLEYSVPTEMEDPLAKDIDQFAEGASVLLAATLLQATPDARNLSQIVATLGFGDIDAADSQSWQQFAAMTLASVGLAVFVVWVTLYFAHNSLIGFGAEMDIPIGGLNPNKIGNLTDRIHVTGINTAVSFGFIFLILMYLREKKLNGGTWESRLSAYVNFIIWAGIPAGLLASLVLVLLPWSNLQYAYSIFVFTIIAALLSAGFFVRHMRAASTCRNGAFPTLKTVFGPGVFLHAAVAVLVGGVLQFLMQSIDTENAPGRSLQQIQREFNSLINPNPTAAGPAGPFNSESVPALQENLNTLSGQFASFPTLDEGPHTADLRANVMNMTTAFCKAVDQGLGLPPRGTVVSPCAANGALAKADDSANQKAAAQFREDVETFYNNLVQLSDPDLAQKLPWLQVFIGGAYSLIATLFFGVALRVSRICQLRNQLDQFDESTLLKLKERAKKHLVQQGEQMAVEDWLVTPNNWIKFLAPIEGIRYAPYRAPLFDSVPMIVTAGGTLRVIDKSDAA